MHVHISKTKMIENWTKNSFRTYSLPELSKRIMEELSQQFLCFSQDVVSFLVLHITIELLV